MLLERENTNCVLLILHYGIIYHVHHPCLLFTYINIILQIIYNKGDKVLYEEMMTNDDNVESNLLTSSFIENT